MTDVSAVSAGAPLVPAFATLVDLLRERARATPERLAFTYLEGGERETDAITYAGLDQKARAIAAYLQQQGFAGERALMLLPSGIDFVAAFFGCLYAAVVPVPAPLPERGRFGRMLPRLEAMAEDARARVVLTLESVIEDTRAALASTGLGGLAWLGADALGEGPTDGWEAPRLESGSLAFLQYTSGSTRLPKGVMVGHGNLLANLEAFARLWAFTADDAMVSWLPLFHDMGLIFGVLLPVYGGFPCHMMTPEAFVARPMRWLEGISRYRGSVTAAPNFAFDLCVRKSTPEQRAALDLRSWRVAWNAAEPVRKVTLDRFAAVFAASGFDPAAMSPGWGLAEATLHVTVLGPGRGPAFTALDTAALERRRVRLVPGAREGQPGVRSFVGCGHPSIDVQLLIVDPETLAPCAADEIGEIWVGGPFVAQGYWNRPEETAATFGARTRDGAGPFMRTGDLGYLVDGEVYLAGRHKDVVILRGRNHYPQDLETTVEESHPALRPGCSAAFSVEVGGEERLAIVAEVDEDRLADDRAAATARLLDAIRRAVVTDHEVVPAVIGLIGARQISKTSSGKIQRRATRARLLARELQIVGMYVEPAEEAAAAASRAVDGEVATDSASRSVDAVATASASVDGEVALALAAAELAPPPASLPAAPPVAEDALRDALRDADEVGRVALVRGYLEWLVALKTRQSGPPPSDLPLSDVGLDSLALVEVAERLTYQLGVAVEVQELADGRTLPDLAAALAARRTDVLPAGPGDRFEPFPLYGIQQAYWVGRAGGVSCHLYQELERDGLDLARLERAWTRLIERHDALRLVVDADGAQRVLPFEKVGPYAIACEDLGGLADDERERRLLAARERMSHHVLPSDRYPLFEIRALRLGGGRLRVLVSIDLLVADGASMALLLGEWRRLYSAPERDLPPLPPYTFRDCALADQAARHGDRYRASMAFWAARRPAFATAPDLPLARRPEDVPVARFTRRRAVVAPEVWNRLKVEARRRGMTPSVVLCAAFAEALEAWCTRKEFLLNLTTFRRAPVHPRVGEIVGDFTTMAFLACRRPADEPFAAFARALQVQLHEQLDHRIVHGVEVLREWGRSGPIQVPIVFTSMVRGDGTGQWDTAWLGDEVHGISQTPHVWLDFQVLEQNGDLVCRWDAIEALFPAGLLDAMFAAFIDRLEELSKDADWDGPRVELVPPAQRALFAAVNATERPLAISTLTGLFAAQVAARPDAPALIASEQALSYGQLAAMARALGRRLRALGAEPDALVAIVMEKGWEQVPAALGVLESGAAYLPVDATLPAERCLHMLARGRVRLALTQAAIDASFPWPANITRVVVDDRWLADEEVEQVEVARPVRPDDLAYVLFTSGSTGAPKGVMIEHRSAVNTVVDVDERYGVGPADRVLALSSLSFDLSVYDLFGVLGAGGAVVMPTAAEREDPLRWAAHLRRGVTVWNTVPALLQLLIDHARDRAELAAAMQSLRVVMLSGDWIPVPLPDALRAIVPHAQVVSLGGPTEATIWQATYPIGAVDPAWPSIPYGRPLANHRIHVLDARLAPCPVWVPGELYIGGLGLARGYWDDPARTAELFIVHPRTGERLYRSGDWGRWLPDGTLEFLGRHDQQVKVNGHRIELGEVEACLGRDDEVAHCAVVAVGERAPRLVAHVVARGGSTGLIARLQRRCGESLPAYMVPSAFQVHERLPLSANGKVDRGALARLGVAVRAPTAASRPSGPSRDLVLTIAREAAAAFDLPAVDVDTPFGDLGVDSVMTLRLRSRLARALGRELPLTLAYDHPTVTAIARFVGGGDEPVGAEPVRAASDEPIAVIGMACRLPGAVDSPESLWALFDAGRDATEDVPAHRWDLAAVHDPDPAAPGKTYCGRGGFLGDVTRFDAAFFGITPREARGLDPQQRLLLEVTWETLERAGVRPDALAGRPVGVYLGLSTHEYLWLGGHAPEEVLDGYGITGSTFSVASGRLAYVLGLEGPAITVDTACSSSLVTIHLACQALRAGECEMALAGGASLILSPELYIEFSRLRALAPDGRSKAFSARADGVVWSEGCGMVLLKPLSAAERDGDTILGVVRGLALNQDGRSNGLTAPSGPAQERVIRRALAVAGLGASDVDLIEAHGTGTTLGDPIEAGALAATYGRDRGDRGPAWLGSSKSNMGHTLSAAGVTGLMKVLLALEHERMPQTLFADEATPHVDWARSGLALLQRPRPWPREPGRPRRAGVSSFGISGTNAHVVVEEAPPRAASVPAELPVGATLVVSGRTDEALRDQARRWAQWLRAHPDARVADVLHTAAHRRAPFKSRAALLVADHAGMVDGLAALADGRAHPGLVTGQAGGATAVMFSGQGSQYAGMGRGLLADWPVFHDALERACEALDRYLRLDRRLIALLDDGPAIDRTGLTQPALFAVEVALYRQWEAWGLEPALLLGHSVGELAAAHVAGVLALDDAARLVVARGRLMDAMRSDGAMASIAASEAELAPLLDARVDLAGLSGPQLSVISGDADAVDALLKKFRDMGRRVHRLTVSHAFHSPHMDAMLDDLAAVVAGCRFSPPRVPIVSTLTGRRATAEDLARPAYWVEQARRTVRFADAVRGAWDEGVRAFIECGPDSTLCGMGPGCLPEDADAAFIPSQRRRHDANETLARARAAAFVAGAAISPESFAPARGELVALPTYAWQRALHWREPPARETSPATLGGRPARFELGGRWRALPDGGVLHELPVGVHAQPYLADHRIHGHVVVPGTFHVGVLLALAAERWPDAPVALEALVFKTPLLLDADRDALLVAQLRPDGDGFRVTLDTRDDRTDAWRTHVEARIAPAADLPTALPDILEKDAELSIGFAEIVATLAAGDVDWGPRWAATTLVLRSGDVVTARLTRPAGESLLKHAPVSPVLLDNASAAGMAHRWPPAATDDPAPRLPFAIERLVWSGRVTDITTSRRVRRPGESVEVEGADLSLHAADGSCVLAISGMTIKRAPRDRFLGAPEADGLYEVTLERVDLPAATHDFVVIDDPALAERLAAPHHPDLTTLPAIPGRVVCSLKIEHGARAAIHRAAQQLHDALALPTVELVFVARTDDRLELELTVAAVRALLRAVRLEHPDRALRLVELDEPASLPSALALTSEPELVLRAGEALAPRLQKAARAPATPPDLASGTTLITGGTGALGRALARHLVARHGVRRLVLASRRGPDAPGVPALVAELLALGATSVDVVPCDVADREAVRALLAPLPDLRAVFHLAGQLDDGLFAGLDHPRIDLALLPKLDGALHLHELTAQLPLAAFVLFSSAAALFGSPGQSSYAAGNGALDGLATWRRAHGLPATSLAFGPWEPTADAGMTAALAPADLTRMRRQGLLPLALARGLALLDAAIARPDPALALLEFQPRLRTGAVPPLLRRMITAAPAAPGGELRERLAALPEAERPAELLALVREEIAGVVGLAPAAVPGDRPLRELGLDSLMAVEVRNHLVARTRVPLPATLVFDHPTPRAIAAHLLTHLGALTPAPTVITPAPTRADEPLAIVAMACRFPGEVETPEQLWDLLARGRDAISDVPRARFDVDAWYDPDPERVGTTYARTGGFIGDVERFDADFFRIAPVEARGLDPQGRLLLECAWEAIERAGVRPDALVGSATGVYVGLCGTEVLVDAMADAHAIDAYSLLGAAHGAIVGRVSYCLGLQGPNFPIDTACSSSLVALHLACQGLRARECDLALVGGVNLLLAPESYVYFSRLRALSPTGRSRAFSADADGYARGEGCGVLVLKRLADARRDGDRVLALVRGTAVNQDGRSNGFTAPNGPAQQDVIRRALRSAGVAPASVGYVECHGTGTPLGDPIEVQALAAVYGEGRGRDDAVVIGSIKSNIGHTEGAAGIAGVMKAVLALQHAEIPATLHVGAPNPRVPWDELPVRIATAPQPFVAHGAPRRAAVSSFGFSGTNAHTILEEAPRNSAHVAPRPAALVLSDQAAPRPSAPVLSGSGEAPSDPAAPLPLTLPLVISGQGGALRDQAARWAAWLQADPGVALVDVVHTAAVRRTHFEDRATLRVATLAQAVEALAAVAADRPHARVVRATARERRDPVFVCSGQGGQWAGMGRALEQQSPAFAAVLAAGEAAFASLVPLSVAAVLRGDVEAPQDRPDVVQPALFVLGVGLAAAWAELGVTPACVVGHSLGEVVAAVVAGALTLAEGALVVAHRSRLVQDLADPGDIAHVALPEAEARRRIAARGDALAVAAVNGATATVVAGDTDALAEFIATLQAEGVFCRRIAMGYAAHSRHVEPALAPLAAALAGLRPRATRVPFWSTVTGTVVPGESLGADYWCRNLRAPVRFDRALAALRAAGHAVFVELAPHPVLAAALAEQAGDGVVVGSLERGDGGLGPLLAALGQLHVHGLAVDWARALQRFAGQRVDLPTYAFQRERHWPAPRTGAARPGDLHHGALRTATHVAADGRDLFTGRLALAEQPWMADHVILGQPLFPATGWLDLALAAGRAVGLPALELLTLEVPLIVGPDAAVEVQVALDPADATGRRALAIHTRAAGAPWTRNARGSVTHAPPLEPPAAPTPWPPPGATPIDLDDLHAEISAAGLTYGPAFRGLVEAHRAGDHLLARVRLPASLAAEATRHTLHPALLDAATHLLALARLRGGQGTALLPVAWSGVTLRATGAAELRVRVDLTHAGDDAAALALHLTDPSGRPVLDVDALEFRRTRVAPPLAAPALHRVAWEPIALPITPDARPLAVIGDGPVARARGHRGLADLSALPGRVPDLILVDATIDPEVTLSKNAAEQARRSAQRALQIVQTWLTDVRLAPTQLVWISRGALGPGAADPGSAAAWGLLRAALQEHPDRALRLIDLDPRAPIDPTLLARALALPGEPELLLRDGEARTPRLVRAPATTSASTSATTSASTSDFASTSPATTSATTSASTSDFASTSPASTSAPTSASTSDFASTSPASTSAPGLADGAVWISGATGALGARVARHLVAHRGARHLLLSSRRGPDAPGAAALIADLKHLGAATVLLLAGDLADRPTAAAHLAALGDRPLVAVLHLAGALDDGVLTALTPDRLDRVLAPKVDAAVHLDALTRDRPLRAFILFSSLAGWLGGEGQASYAAANTVLDALAEHRRALGLPATSLAWGPWAGDDADALAGMAARVGAHHQARMRRRGLPPISTDLGLRWLDAAWAGDDAVPALLDLEALQRSVDTSKTTGALWRRLLGVRLPDAAQGVTPLDASQPAEVRRARALELVRSVVAAVLGGAADGVREDRPLAEMGLDSLMAVRLRNELAARSGAALPVTLVYDHPTAGALADLLVQLTGRTTVAAPTIDLPADPDEPIAIVGAACRLPDGLDDPESLWRALDEGRDLIGPFPARWDTAAIYDPDPEAPGKTYAREGGFLRDLDGFDAAFFGIAPREAAAMDPQQRVILETAWEAIERAGLRPADLRERPTGVYVGAARSEYLQTAPLAAMDGYGGTGTAASVTSGRIAYALGLQGPAITVDTACSSSLVAMHLACAAIRAGDCEVALAGGVQALISPAIFVEFSRLRGLARDGRCKAFAEAADGAGWSEGCGVVVLKRLSRAQRDGDRILAVVRGTATNQDGRSQGLTAPSGPAQARVIRRALERSGLGPDAIDYVEAHGTGTALGDPIEAGALAEVFAPGRERPLLLGALKSNIGHTQAAAGVLGVIKVVLALAHERLPRTLHAERPSTHVDWDASRLALVQRATPWPRSPGRPRRAGVSSFGVSGTNAHVILEEPPTARDFDPTSSSPTHRDDPTSSPTHAEPAPSPTPRDEPALRARLAPLVLSGRDEPALRAQAARWAAFLDARPAVPWTDIRATAALRRVHHDERAAISGADPIAAREALHALADGSPHPALRRARARARGRAVFVFPGQGGQWPAMGRDLLLNSRAFADAVAACDAALRPFTGWSVTAALRGDADAPDLARVDVVQPTLFALAIGLAAVWRDLGVEPDAVVGHSQGEIAAAVVAGALSIADGARVVAVRSGLLRRLACTGAMLVVEHALTTIEPLLRPYGDALALAAVNAPESLVLSGTPAAIAALAAELEASGAFVRRVDVDYASHSAAVDPILAELRDLLAPLRPRDARVPLYSTVTGERLAGPALGADYWCTNLRRPVRFDRAVARLLGDGHGVFVELGARPTLAVPLQQLGGPHDAVVIGSLRRDVGGLAPLVDGLAELHVHGVPVDLARLLPARPPVPLPTYAWQHERFWIDDPPAPVAAPPRMGLGRGRRTTLRPGARIWDVTLDPRALPWLADHRVQGAIVLPGAGAIELLLTAGRELLGDRFAIADLEFERPIELAPDAAWTGELLALPDPDGSSSFKIRLSRPADPDGDGDWLEHVHARLVPDDATEAPPLTTRAPGDATEVPPLATLAPDDAGLPTLTTLTPDDAELPTLATCRARCTVAVPREDHLALLRARGLELGPAFQTAAELWRAPQGADTREALGRLVLPSSLAGHAHEFHAHPALLDAALGLPAAASADDDAADGVWLLRRVARLRSRAALGREIWARATVRGAGDRVDATIETFDQTGAVRLTAEGVELVRIAAAPARTAPWIGVRFHPAPAPAIVAREPGVWLLVGDPGPLGAPLTAALAAHGQTLRHTPDLSTLDTLHDAPLHGVLVPGAVRPLESHTTDAPQDPAPADVDAALATIATTLDILRKLAHGGHTPTPRLVILTRGAQPVADPHLKQPILQVADATLWGLGRTIALEHPELACLRLDLDPILRADEPAAIARELLAAPGPDEVALRDGVRLVARVERLTDLPTRTGAAIHEDATYLVTGGLGGLGLLAAGWLADAGARHLVLAARRPPTAPEQHAALAALRARGVDVRTAAVDVADADAVARLFAGLAGPPLRGVLHLAGALDDGLLLHQTGPRVRAVFAAKVLGAVHLHRATRTLPLDHFILFSSATAVLGAAGIGNYAAANAFLDALAHHRRGRGLPALAIDWGLFAGHGMGRTADDRGRASERGVRSFTPEVGGQLLRRLLTVDVAQVGAVDLDVARWLAGDPAVARLERLAPLLADARPAADDAPALVAALRDALPSEQPHIVETFVREQAARVLRVRLDRLAVDQPLQDLGIDSVMGLELRNRLRDALGQPLPAALLWTYPTVARIAGHLLALHRDAHPSTPGPAPVAVDPLLAAFDTSIDAIDELVRR